MILQLPKTPFKSIAVFFSAVILSSTFFIYAEEPAEAPVSGIIYRIRLEGPVTPSLKERLTQAIKKAEENNAKALIAELDTPGGLMSSMDDMIRSIMVSSVPVITYVGPAGSTCGSAGVYILYSSHLAAMAPATNLGSATPVTMGGQPQPSDPSSEETTDAIPEKAGTDDSVNLKRKTMNHAVAQIRSLAEYRGRNVTFAEKSITHAENITSSEALKRGVIELIAESPEELIRKAHGKKVRMLTETITLDLQDAEIILIEKDVRSGILSVISDPNIAYIFMMIGMLGIIAEIQYPGSVFPGVAGAISLLLGLYAMQTLPVNYTGLGLIVLGIVLMILEVKVISYGLLTISGIASMILGSLMLLPGDEAFYSLSFALVTGFSIGTGLITASMVYLASKAMKSHTVSLDTNLEGAEADVTSAVSASSGFVRLNGELWSARITDGSPLPAGSRVKVTGRKGTVLYVKAL